MKNKILSLSLILLCANVFALETENKLEKSNLSKNPEKKVYSGLEVAAGYYQLNNTFKAGGSEELSGQAVSVSMDFNLAKGFHTKGTLRVSWVDNQEDRSSYDTDSEFSHFTFSQNLSYPIKKNGFIFKPYFSLGFGRGNYTQKTSGFDSLTQEELGFSGFTTKGRYAYRMGSVGMQVLLENGLAPYIEYETSVIAFDYDNTSFKRNASKDRVDVKTSLEDIESKSLTIGLSYLF